MGGGEGVSGVITSFIINNDHVNKRETFSCISSYSSL